MVWCIQVILGQYKLEPGHIKCILGVVYFPNVQELITDFSLFDLKDLAINFSTPVKKEKAINKILQEFNGQFFSIVHYYRYIYSPILDI